MALTMVLAMVGFTVFTSIVLLALSFAAPAGTTEDAYGIDGLGGGSSFDDGRPRIRLLSRLLFTRRQPESIVIDCLLLAVEQAGPGVTAPEGLPFTLQLRAPDTAWFAERVDDLLTEWADDSRELMVELREDHGTVRTRIASGDASLQLELSGAAGLTLTG